MCSFHGARLGVNGVTNSRVLGRQQRDDDVAEKSFCGELDWLRICDVPQLNYAVNTRGSDNVVAAEINN
jgi:hypothetical protein